MSIDRTALWATSPPKSSLQPARLAWPVGDWAIADVAVSTIHYSDSGVRLKAVYADSKASEVKKRWGFVVSHAKYYKYAEQALPAGVTTRRWWDNWPQSEYRIGDQFNNSNTFVREILIGAQLPVYELSGLHPGSMRAYYVAPPYTYGSKLFKGTPPDAPVIDG